LTLLAKLLPFFETAIFFRCSCRWLVEQMQMHQYWRKSSRSLATVELRRSTFVSSRDMKVTGRSAAFLAE